MAQTRGRPFQRGNTYGRGRPTGSLNKMNVLWQGLEDQYGEAIVKKCMAQALHGDRTAMRLCMERMMPPRRNATVRLKLPSSSTLAGIDESSDVVLRAIGQGHLTPEQGGIMAHILENRRRIAESVELRARVDKLEELTDDRGSTED